MYTKNIVERTYFTNGPQTPAPGHHRRGAEHLALQPRGHGGGRGRCQAHLRAGGRGAPPLHHLAPGAGAECGQQPGRGAGGGEGGAGGQRPLQLRGGQQRGHGGVQRPAGGDR